MKWSYLQSPRAKRVVSASSAGMNSLSDDKDEFVDEFVVDEKPLTFASPAEERVVVVV